MKKRLPGIALSLMIVTVLLCACGKAKTAESGTPVAGQGVPALTVSAEGVDTPAAVSAEAAPLPTSTPVPQTNTPTATATPEPTYTSPPTPTGTPGPTGTPISTPTPTSTHVPPTPTTPLRLGTVVYVVRAGDSLAAIARAYGVTVAAIAEANNIQDANTIHVGQELVIPDPARIPAGPVVQPPAPARDGGQTAALEQLEDTDPGPPFTIEVSLNRATQDPLVAESRIYKVTGIVRNDGDRPYAVSAIHVTFFDASGFRGRFVKFPQPWEQGGEWHRHGETEAGFAALFLAPGEEWPFSVEITAQDMASFMIHPDAASSDREPAAVELSGVQVVDTGSSYARIRGTATNTSPFEVKNVIVSGVLIDAGGRIVSIGSTFGLEEDIAPGASVRFDLRVEKEPYVRYRLYAQAERDWD